jgi:hypothetical protein
MDDTYTVVHNTNAYSQDNAEKRARKLYEEYDVLDLDISLQKIKHLCIEA